MSSKVTTARNLSTYLHAFLAQGRCAGIDAQMWHEFEIRVLCCSNTESEQILSSCFSALQTHHDKVSNLDWGQFIESFRTRVRTCGYAKLLAELPIEVIEIESCSDGEVPKKRPHELKDTSFESGPESKRTCVNNDPTGSDILSASPTTQILYADTFRLLKTQNVPDRNHAMRLNDVILAGAHFAIICNFKFDMQWMWGHAAGIQTCQKVLIVHGEGEEEEKEWSSFFQTEGVEQRVRFYRPRTPAYGTVHTKMFVLFYGTGCRVCIHTANMIPCDWDWKTQGAYMRDFPKLCRSEDGASSSIQVEDDFKVQLCRYFEAALGGETKEEVISSLHQYDFTSAGVALVSSVPGTHRGPERKYHGHARLRQLLSKEDIANVQEPSVAICQFSSLGSIQKRWLEDEFWNTLFASKSTTAFTSNLQRLSREIKLVFPTVEQVKESNEGLQAGASLPVSEKNIDREHITEKLHKWDGQYSGREQAMPHIKTFLRYAKARPQAPFWVFLGSFNLSVAAWGRMQGAKGRQEWDRMKILSYEVGVLFSPRVACAAKFGLATSVKYGLSNAEECEKWRLAHEKGAVSLEICEDMRRVIDRGDDSESGDDESKVVLRIPLPYSVPPPEYESRDRPWTTSYCNMT